MPYRLKENVPDFDVVDGPFAGRRYRKGEIYAEIPPEEKDRFEEAVTVKSEELGVKSRKTASPPDASSSHPPIAASPDPANGGDNDA